MSFLNEPFKLAIVIFSKNEAKNISDCVSSCDSEWDIFVVDSSSTDGTQTIAKSLGATVVDFKWNGSYPRKKQWTIEFFKDYEWLLLLDADERITKEYLNEVSEIIAKPNVAAGKTKIIYRFLGKTLKYGHKVTKVNLLRRNMCAFPDLESSLAGNGDIEMHYQPNVSGKTLNLSTKILHDDRDPLVSWVRRHVLYAELEAEMYLDQERTRNTLGNRSLGGRIFGRTPFKPFVFFTYSYFFRLGFLDRRPGFLYSFYLSWYYSLISAIKIDKKNG